MNTPGSNQLVAAGVADVKGVHLLSATLSAESSWPRTVTPKMTDQQPLSLLNSIISPDSYPGTSSTLTHGPFKYLKIEMAHIYGTCSSLVGTRMEYRVA